MELVARAKVIGTCTWPYVPENYQSLSMNSKQFVEN